MESAKTGPALKDAHRTSYIVHMSSPLHRLEKIPCFMYRS